MEEEETMILAACRWRSKRWKKRGRKRRCEMSEMEVAATDGGFKETKVINPKGLN